MIDHFSFTTLFKPIYGFYVPSGWTIMKNNVFDINSEGFLQIKNDKRYSMEEYEIIDSTIFLANCEVLYGKYAKKIGVVDIGCHIVNEKLFELKYDINLNIFEKNKKNRKTVFSQTEYSITAKKSALIASNFMRDFNEEIFDLKSQLE